MLVRYQSVGGLTVWLNPAQITHITSSGDGGTSIVHFVGGETVTLSASNATLAKDLDHYLTWMYASAEER